MSEENKSTITYDENWQSVSSPEYPQITDLDEYEFDEGKNEKEPQKRKDKNSPKQLLITIQLIACIIIVLAAFIIKNIGGDVYAAAHEWYYGNLNDSAIFDGDAFDLSELFDTATKDEV